jgi:hypothetical protein
VIPATPGFEDHASFSSFSPGFASQASRYVLPFFFFSLQASIFSQYFHRSPALSPLAFQASRFLSDARPQNMKPKQPLRRACTGGGSSSGAFAAAALVGGRLGRGGTAGPPRGAGRPRRAPSRRRGDGDGETNRRVADAVAVPAISTGRKLDVDVLTSVP